jgi:hypothetical protein
MARPTGNRLMKDKTFEISLSILAICVFAGGTFGMIKTLETQNNDSRKRAETGCSLIAKESQAKDWVVDSSYNCLIYKNNKIIKIEDW